MSKPLVIILGITALVYVAGFFISGGGVEAQVTENVKYSEEWLVCKADADCVKEYSVCGGVGVVNKAFQKPYQDWVAQMNMVSSCFEDEQADKAYKKAVPGCVNSICGVR